MPDRGRIAHGLIIGAGLMLGSCMENPERVSADKAAAEANENALRALRQVEELEGRLQRVEEKMQNRTAPPAPNAS